MPRKVYRAHLCGEQIYLKKYFYALRPLLACRWLEQQNGLVPMRFSELLKATVQDPQVGASIAQLLVRKRLANETQDIPPLALLNTVIERELNRLESVLPVLPSRVDFPGLDRLLMTTVLRAERALDE
jgi:predicted nucleotidyltransferase